MGNPPLRRRAIYSENLPKMGRREWANRKKRESGKYTLEFKLREAKKLWL